jgi:ABC-type multidrug transport system fused ATPase/permease subunit
MIIEILKTFKAAIKKSNFIISSKYNSQLILYIFMSLIGGLLEMLSIGLLLPILFILLDFDDNIFLAQVFNNLFLTFDIISKNEQLVFSAIILSISYLIKNLLLSYIYWFQANLTTKIQIFVQNSFFSNYLNQSILYQSTKNSAQLIRNLMGETTQFTKGFIFNFLSLILDSLICFFLLILIFITDFKSSLVVIIFFSFLSLFFLTAFKRFIKNMGIKRLKNEEARLRYFQESLGSIREIKILGKIQYLIDKFSKHNSITMNIIKKSGLVTIFPRLLIETLLVFLISASLIYFLVLDYSYSKVVLILGMLGACAFRMMPLITKIINSSNLILYSKPSMDTLYEYFKDYDLYSKTNKTDFNHAEVNFKFENQISFKAVNFSYSNKDNFSLSDLNFEIKKGDRVGIIGKTGSGKSTLIDLLLGLIDPLEGQIMIDGFDLKKNKLAWNKKIGYVAQETFLLDDTISKNIGMGFDKESLNIQKINQLIQICNLKEDIHKFSGGLNTMVGERGARLSGGQKQRIGLARSLYRNPSVLILDEATSAIDKSNEFDILTKIFENKNLTIIMITHRNENLSFCNRIFNIENSKLFEDNK